jgi:hypothetical protein
MMAAEVEDGGGGWQQWRTMTTATADDDNGDGGPRQQQTTTVATTTACKIGWQTTRGKEDSRQQTKTALEPAGQRVWKNKEIELTQKDFFQQYGLSGWIFAPAETPNGTF